MKQVASEQVRIEADSDQGVASRVLDLLVVADRFPCRLVLEHDGPTLSLGFELDPSPADIATLTARMRQIPGVRRVVAVGASP
jgi:hypothetical protein